MEVVDTLVRDFEIQANGDYSKTWALVDFTTGTSLLTPTTLMHLHMCLSSTPDVIVKTLEVRADKEVSGIVLSDDIATSGEFDVTLRIGDMSTLFPAGVTKVAYKYNLIVWDSADPLLMKTAYVKGKMSFLAGVPNGG